MDSFVNKKVIMMLVPVIKNNHCNDAEIIIMGMLILIKRVGEGDNDVNACDSYGDKSNNCNHAEFMIVNL